MAAVQSRGRIGRVGDIAVDGVGHLVTDNGELVHLHCGLVFAIDALVSQQTGGSDLKVQSGWSACIEGELGVN